MIISRDENYLKCATPMLRTYCWEAPFGWGRLVACTMLQALQYDITTTIFSFIATFIENIAFQALIILY